MNEYANALVVALPFATKLNTATNADVANLSNYIAGKEVIIDGNVFQTDFFKGDEARVTDLFLFMSTKKNVVLETFNTQDKNTRLLTYKVLLEKFNDKYSNLEENQKTLLKEYVNSVSNSPALKSYINQEINEVKKKITSYSKKIEDKVVAIKLNETKNMIKPLTKNLMVQDKDVSNLLNYYELINELKTIHG